jgi:phosphoenolpyruvate-protein kinase (PTS system EI component)
LLRKKLHQDIIFLDKQNSQKNIDNKIVVIENADPGYDWIFTKNIVGLITKYGGANSHMAIRCSRI